MRDEIRAALLRRGAPADVADSLAQRIEDLAREVQFTDADSWPELAGLPVDQVQQIIGRMEQEAAAIVKRLTMGLMVQNVSLELQLRKANQRRR
jgi:hypothetical protein